MHTVRRSAKIATRSYEPHNSARQLLNRTEQLFSRYLHFAERDSGLLAVFAMSTWIAGRLPTAPALVI